MIAVARTYADLLELAQAAMPVSRPTKPLAQPIESNIDPHRLARIFLHTQFMHSDGPTLRWWRQEWWFWTGHKYATIERPELKAKFTATIKAEFDRLNIEQQGDPESDEKEVRMVTRNIVNDAMGALESMVTVPGYVVQPTMLNGPRAGQPHMIAFENGILNIDTIFNDEYELRRPTPLWFSGVCLPYDCDLSNAEPLAWKAALARNLEGDQQKIDLLQEWAGYCITNDLRETKFLILEGQGGTGKSTYLAGLEAMLGFDNCSHVPLEIFGQRFALTSTLGRLANICGDAGEIDKVAEGHIKAFTDGNPMTFDRKGLSPVEAKPSAKLIIACNTCPRWSDKTEGIYRRISHVEWTKPIPESEKNKRMKEMDWWHESGELPAIFAWAIEGMLRVRKDGFTVTDAEKVALTNLRQENSPTRMFLEESCVNNRDCGIPCGELYAEYRAWAEANGYRLSSERTFGKDVARVFPQCHRRKLGTRGDRFWNYSGVAFNEDFQPSSDKKAVEARQKTAF